MTSNSRKGGVIEPYHLYPCAKASTKACTGNGALPSVGLLDQHINAKSAAWDVSDMKVTLMRTCLQLFQLRLWAPLGSRIMAKGIFRTAEPFIELRETAMRRSKAGV